MNKKERKDLERIKTSLKVCIDILTKMQYVEEDKRENLPEGLFFSSRAMHFSWNASFLQDAVNKITDAIYCLNQI